MVTLIKNSLFPLNLFYSKSDLYKTLYIDLRSYGQLLHFSYLKNLMSVSYGSRLYKLEISCCNYVLNLRVDFHYTERYIFTEVRQKTG